MAKARASELITTTMDFDAYALATGWSAVSLAWSKDKARPILCHSVLIEFFEGKGARLVSTDGYALFMAWVPRAGTPPTMPTLTARPTRSIIARDHHGRSRGLMAHVRNLLQGEDAQPMEMTLSVGPPALDAERGPLTFAGLESEAVLIDVPDEERLIVGTVDGKYPNWAQLFEGHNPTATRQVVLSPTQLQRLGKLDAYYPGGITMTFGGAKGAVLIETETGDPYLRGLVMPMSNAGMVDA